MNLPAIKQDTRGVVIHPEQLVAYNRSGDVVLGRVLEVTNSHIKVRPVDQGYFYRPKFSKVKRGHSLIVLTPPGENIPLPPGKSVTP